MSPAAAAAAADWSCGDKGRSCDSACVYKEPYAQTVAVACCFEWGVLYRASCCRSITRLCAVGQLTGLRLAIPPYGGLDALAPEVSSHVVPAA